MEINIKNLKYHINSLKKIRLLINFEFKYLLFAEEIDRVLKESTNVLNPFIGVLPTCHYTKLTGMYSQCVLKLKRDLYKELEKKRLSNSELGKLIQSLNMNIYYLIVKNSEYCKDCNNFLIRHRNEWFCQRCNIFRGRIYLSKDEELDEDIKQKKSNISKHFDANLNRIYGIIDDKTVLPECGLKQLRKKLDDSGFDITKQVHYTYSLINQLKRFKHIECTCEKGSHKIVSCKKQVNYIITKIYPEIKIPRLMGIEYIVTRNTFLTISAVYQQLFPGNYNMAYQYILHRILNLNFPNRTNVLELLRFIYPQKQSSFHDKDVKFRAINDKIKCFKEFRPLPSDIYSNIMHYKISKKINYY